MMRPNNTACPMTHLVQTYDECEAALKQLGMHELWDCQGEWVPGESDGEVPRRGSSFALVASPHVTTMSMFALSGSRQTRSEVSRSISVS